MKISMQRKINRKKLDNGFTEFIQFCRVRNLSMATTDYYEECFRIFTDFYSKENEISDISKATVQQYILHLKSNTNLNTTSINTRLRGLRAFLYYFMKMEYMQEFKIELLKAQKKIKETYSDAELKLLLSKPDLKRCDFTEYRDWVIINYLLSTGNRVSTVVNIKIKNIDFESGTVMLEKTKSKKQQIVPLSKTLSKILVEYLSYRKGEAEDYLFCNIHGGKLTTNALSHSVAKYNKRRGVFKTSIHLFRHTFAKKWILAGGDMFRLQKILGHSSLEIVKEYVNMFSEDLQRDFNRFNALEQMTVCKQSIRMRKK